MANWPLYVPEPDAVVEGRLDLGALEVVGREDVVEGREAGR